MRRILVATVKELVDSYIEILPESASSVQVRETKMAFIAGMYAFRNLSIAAANQKSIEMAETRMVMMERELEIVKNELIKEGEEARDASK